MDSAARALTWLDKFSLHQTNMDYKVVLTKVSANLPINLVLLLYRLLSVWPAIVIVELVTHGFYQPGEMPTFRRFCNKLLIFSCRKAIASSIYSILWRLNGKNKRLCAMIATTKNASLIGWAAAGQCTIGYTSTASPVRASWLPCEIGKQVRTIR